MKNKKFNINPLISMCVCKILMVLLYNIYKNYEIERNTEIERKWKHLENLNTLLLNYYFFK